MSENTVPTRVFVSHTSLDKKFTRQLAYDLKKAGVEVWFDEWEIRVGDSLREKVERGIHESGWLIIVLSPRAVASQWVQRELSAAFARELDDKRVFILPVLLEKCELPVMLRDKKYADFTENYSRGLQELLQTILPTGSGSTAPFGELIDVNAHLWMERFESDLNAIIERARTAGVSKIIASACNGPYSWSRSLEISARFNNIYVSLALHPTRGPLDVGGPGRKLDSPTDEELALLESFITNEKVIAIGDVQLQYQRQELESCPRDRQIEILDRHLFMALRYQIPVIAEIHGGQQANEDFLGLMDSGYQGKIRVAVQCPISKDFAISCSERGYYQIITGNYAFPKAESLREMLGIFPQERLLLASNCPAFAPPPLRGNRNEPSYLPNLLAALRGFNCCIPQELAYTTTHNAMRFFEFGSRRYPKPAPGQGLPYTFG